MPGTACLVTRWLEVECLVSAAAILLFQLVKSTILGCIQYTAHRKCQATPVPAASPKSCLFSATMACNRVVGE